MLRCGLASHYEFFKLELPRDRTTLEMQFLTDVVRQEQPIFIFLCETIASKEKLEWVGNMLRYEGLFVVEPQGRSGGLALLWKAKDQADLLSYSQFYIDIKVHVADMITWRLTE